MILTHDKLQELSKTLQRARIAAVEGTDMYCTKKDEGRDGVHGRAFLGIDPETGEIGCERCRSQKRSKK